MQKLLIYGSNAYMLSGELATLLSGRYIKMEMLPLSFSEYVRVKENEKSTDESYLEYIETSSFPYTINLEKENRQLLLLITEAKMLLFYRKTIGMRYRKLYT